VKNTTGRAVRILRVEKSCTCTAAEVSQEVLGTGQCARLRLSVKVPGVRTRVSVSCTLNTDHPTLKDWTYSLAFESLPRIALSDTYLNLGGSEKGAFVPRPQRLQVVVFGRSPSDLPNVQFAAPEDLTVEVEGNPKCAKLAEGAWTTRYRLLLRLSEAHQRTPGLHARSVDVSSPDGRRVSANVSWRYEYPIVATPGYVHFGRVRAGGRSGSRRLSLHSTMGQAFRVLRVTCEGTPASSEASFDPRSALSMAVDVALTIPADAGGGPMTGTVKVETDDREQRVVEVRWSALVDPAGDAKCQGAMTSDPVKPR